MEINNQFFCEKCNQFRTDCPEGRCVSYIKFVRKEYDKEIQKKQEEGKITVSEFMMLHGRLPTLIVLGKKEMADRYKKIEPFINDTRDFWEKEDIKGEAIIKWIEEQPNKEQIISDFDFYTKEVGSFLMENSNVLI